MERKPIKLLVVEDNPEICEILQDFFALTSEVVLCGVAHDGEEALSMIVKLQPDVMLLDLIMPKLDGISVMLKLNQVDLEKRPQIIVTSAVGQETITNKVLSLGASFYMIKPYNLSDLLERICLVNGAETNLATPINKELVKEELIQQDYNLLVSKQLMAMGMPTNVLGYRYCIEAINILLQLNTPCSLVRDVYEVTAKKYNTTSDCVERAIRKAIRTVFLLNNKIFRQVMDIEESVLEKQPSNGKFLTLLSERLRLKID